MLASVAAAVTIILVVSCGTAGTATVSLRDLVNHPVSFDGHRVRTAGDVHRITDSPTAPPYLVLEDDQHDRVLLAPAGPLGSYVDRHVRVEGCFTYDLTHGQRLAVLRLLTPKPAGASRATGPPCHPIEPSA